jgi:hypothetical protein
MFTFKTDQPTGKWKSFEKPYHNIKIKRKKVGSIDAEFPHKINLMVIKKDIMEDGNQNCEWKWVTLKREFDILDEAKLFLRQNYDSITKQFNLKMVED